MVLILKQSRQNGVVIFAKIGVIIMIRDNGKKNWKSTRTHCNFVKSVKGTKESYLRNGNEVTPSNVSI